MANIKEVAALAGCRPPPSPHVINETRFVAEETRERVFAAMRELNYAPSLVARSLKVKETNSIGMLVTPPPAPSSPRWCAVERALLRAGLQPDAGQHRGQAETALSYLKMMLRKRVDGLLIMCSEGQQEVFNQLDWLKSLPVVVMDWGWRAPTWISSPTTPIAAAIWRPATCWGWVTPPSAASPAPQPRPRQPASGGLRAGDAGSRAHRQPTVGPGG